jgi:hypothetical protein
LELVEQDKQLIQLLELTDQIQYFQQLHQQVVDLEVVVERQPTLMPHQVDQVVEVMVKVL